MRDSTDKLKNNTLKVVRECSVQEKRDKSPNPTISLKPADLDEKPAKINLIEPFQHTIENEHSITLTQQAEDSKVFGSNSHNFESKFTVSKVVLNDPEDIFKNNTKYSYDGLKIVTEDLVQQKRSGSLNPEISPKDTEIIHTVANGLDIDLQEKSNGKSIFKNLLANQHIITVPEQAKNLNDSESDVHIFESKFTIPKVEINDPEDMLKNDTEDFDADGIKIEIESPEISPKDIEIIHMVTNRPDIGLSEEPAKLILFDSNGKRILKDLVSNKHVLTVPKQAEDLPIFDSKFTIPKVEMSNPEDMLKNNTENSDDGHGFKIEIESPQISGSDLPIFEQKLTRTKTEETEIQQLQPIEELPKEMLTQEQKLLLQQQMRQHVQLLTQHFLLLYEHPENADLGLKCKEYLYNLSALSVSNTNSYFFSTNLKSAVTIIEGWEKKFKENGPRVQELKRHVAEMLHDCNKNREASIKFTPAFHPAVMDTILNSDVFLYADLLPKMPFKPNKELKLTEYLKPEVELIAIGLEQFIPFVKEDPFHRPSANGNVNLKYVCYYIQRYMLPSKITYRLYKYIQGHRRSCAEMNPVKYFYENNRAPVTLHFVIELSKLRVVPPNQRNVHELPPLWRDYLKSGQARQPHFGGIQSNFTPVQFVNTIFPPACQLNHAVTSMFTALQSITIPSPPKRLTYKSLVRKKRKKCAQKCNPSIIVKEKRPMQVTQSETGKYYSEFSQQIALSPKKAKLDEHFKTLSACKSFALEERLKKLKFNSSTFRKAGLLQKVPLSMMCLVTSPSKSPEPNNMPSNQEKTNSIVTIQNIEASSTLNNCDNSEIRLDESTKSETLSNTEAKTDVKAQEAVKDNLDDINALRVPSSVMKPMTTRRKVTTRGKKKAKQLKEITANLVMLSPESEKDVEGKTNRYLLRRILPKVHSVDVSELRDYLRATEKGCNFDLTSENCR